MDAIHGTLQLIAGLDARRPARGLPAALEPLFRRLAVARGEQEAVEAEEAIWILWMRHPNRRAALVLDRATGDIAGRRFDIAETRLVRLLRACPDYPEAWHKLATLYYLQGRDGESLEAFRRALLLEPRHFAALCSIGEILFGDNQPDGALLAFHSALRRHPFLHAARERLAAIADGKIG